MDSEAGPNSREGQAQPDDKTPPDAEAMRLGRARVANGQAFSAGEPVRMARPVSADPDLIGGNPVLMGAGSELIGGSSERPGSETIDLSPRFRPWSEAAAPDNQPPFCHFLRSVGADGRLAEPSRSAVPTHRCAAFGDPLPLSLRQQELVCLQRVHVSCPRYLRGTLLASEAPAATAGAPAIKESPSFPAMTVAVAAVVVLFLLLVVSGVLERFSFFGGAGSSPTATLIASNSSLSPTASGQLTFLPSGAPSPSPVPTPSATPTAAPSPTPTATPTAGASWPPGATASRMALVVPCGAQADCYIYTVRYTARGPDRLANIASFFGVDIKKIWQLNPSLNGGTAIHTGDKLRIPPPTK